MQRIFVQSLVALLVGFWCVPAVAQQAAPSALLVLGAGENLSSDLLDDVTEAVAFSVGRAKNISFIPKERCQEIVGYHSPREPGSCGFDDECIRSKRKALGVERFIIVRLTLLPQRYRVQVIAVGAEAKSDRSAVGQSSRSSSDLINQIRRLVLPLFEQESLTLQIIPNVADAQVSVDGKALGTGTVSKTVTAGSYRVRVTRAGYVPFEVATPCPSGPVCTVQVNLVPEGAVATAETPMSTRLIVRWSGWATAGVGVAMTTVGIVFGIKARGFQQELDDRCVGRQCTGTQAESESTLAQGNDAATIFNAVGIPGMVLAAGGLTMVALSYLDIFDAEESTAKIIPVVTSDGSFHIQSEWRF